MTHYSVLAVTPTNQKWIEGYLPVANKLIEQHGGRYLASTSDHERLEGEGENPAYRPRLEARLENSTSHHFIVAGQDDQT